MSRKNGQQKTRNGNRENEFSHRLHPETKKSIWAVVFVGLAIIFFLAGFEKAGPAGVFLYTIFQTLLGWGYFALPTIFLVLAGVFFVSERKKFVVVTLVGALLLMLSLLGLIHLWQTGAGGWLGYVLGSLKIPFGETAASLINGVVLLVSILITLNAPLKIRWPEKTEKPEEKEETTPIVTGEAKEAPTEKLSETKKDLKEAEEEPKGKIPLFSKSKKIPAQNFKNYVPPPLDLLTSSTEKPTTGDLRANANIIKRTLESFGIAVEMGEINIGPKVTRYTLKPAEGMKLSRITALNQDLALALASHPIRIEAPIPGKSLVGIEVPNKAAALVRLGSLMVYPEFQSSGLLGFTLGRDVTGEPMFADLEKMPHLLIAGATGSGKTCAADTYVFSEKGMLTFQELCPLPLNSEKEFQLRVAARDGIETTSRNYNNGMCGFYEIETEEGYAIEVTAEHPLWTLSENGQMEWRSGALIKSGDFIAIKRDNNLFGSDIAIDFQPKKNKTNKAKDIHIPAIITPELGLLMGLLTADGGLSIKNRIVYTQADENLLQLYGGLIKNIFGIDTAVVKKSGVSNKAKDILVESKQLKDLFSYLGMKPVKAREKEIPLRIRTSPAEVIKAFLRGLIRNDGHISKNSLEICLGSEILIRQLQLTLLNFGIVSSVKSKKVSAYPGNGYWRLSVYGTEFEKYAEIVGFLTEEEREKAGKIIRRRRNPNKDLIPNIDALLKKLGEVYLNTFAKLTNKGRQYQTDTLIPKYAFNTLRSYNRGDRSPSYRALQNILTFYQPLAVSSEYQTLKEIYDKHFYWAKVRSISRTKGEGYDFEVPGSNSFIGNGFVNHNSIAIQSFIISLLYKNSPSTLKMILVDPKRVELSTYEGIPHLVSPVITENKKALSVFRWAIQEMERRYELLQKSGSRDIKSYNAKLSGDKKEDQSGGRILPYIVIVIDELADLMTSFGREVEGSIVRLAQMSRATGIHLVLSTQRPSVEVITGLIKANITSRIALQVASQIDSRTIIDTSGAEKLLGGGDLLFISSDLSKPKRIQGAYITEEEIKNVVDFIKEHNAETEEEMNFSENARLPDGQEENGISPNFDGDEPLEGNDDELYDEAVEVVRQAQKASASLLQRRLKIGYARAARLLDLMEEKRIIGPGDGAKPREVFLDRKQEI